MLNTPELRALKDRISHSFELGPLRAADVSAYLELRLRSAGYRGATLFGPAAVRALTRAAGGTGPRLPPRDAAPTARLGVARAPRRRGGRARQSLGPTGRGSAPVLGPGRRLRPYPPGLAGSVHLGGMC